MIVDAAARTGCCTDWQTVIMVCHGLLGGGDKKVDDKVDFWLPGASDNIN